MIVDIKKQDSVCAGVVINELSRHQLLLLGECFKRLLQVIEVILIRHIPSFPPAFYQLSDCSALETKEQNLAKRELYWAVDAFHGSVHPYLFKGTAPIRVLRELPEIDYLIGHGFRSSFLMTSHPQFVGNLRDFIAQYNQSDILTANYPIDLSSEKSSHRLFSEPCFTTDTVESSERVKRETLDAEETEKTVQLCK